MQLPFRAAAIAAATVASAAALFLAAPTMALEAPTAPVASPLQFHASASIDGGDLSLNTAPDAAQPLAEPAPVLEHAVQTTDSSDDAETVRRPLHELVSDYSASTTDRAEHE